MPTIARRTSWATSAVAREWAGLEHSVAMSDSAPMVVSSGHSPSRSWAAIRRSSRRFQRTTSPNGAPRAREARPVPGGGPAPRALRGRSRAAGSGCDSRPARPRSPPPARRRRRAGVPRPRVRLEPARQDRPARAPGPRSAPRARQPRPGSPPPAPVSRLGAPSPPSGPPEVRPGRRRTRPRPRRTLVSVARIRLGLCQLNTMVGDLDGNVAKILAAYDEAAAAGCDLAVFPELTITGYPPEDLVLKPRFVAANREALDKVAAHTGALRGGGRLRRRRPRPSQRGGGVRRWPRGRHLPQAVPPELRGVRRAALLRAGRPAPRSSSRSRASRWASPSARTCGARRARSPSSRPAAPSSWSSPTGRRTSPDARPSGSGWSPPGPRTRTATSST